MAMEMVKSMTGPALVASLLVIVVLVFLQRSRKKLPPGPVPWPVVGNFPAISGALPHRVLRRLADKYGGLMYLRLGTKAIMF